MRFTDDSTPTTTTRLQKWAFAGAVSQPLPKEK